MSRFVIGKREKNAYFIESNILKSVTIRILFSHNALKLYITTR